MQRPTAGPSTNEVSLDEVDDGRILDRTIDPTPEEALALADELEWILAQLDPSARRMLELRLQGAQLSEIARETGRSERTVGARSPRSAISWPSGGTIQARCSRTRTSCLQRMIGAGQMGKVYQAWQHSAGRSVAVKYLRKSLLHEPRLVERFIGESRIVARLRHPNIVGVHGLGRTPGGSYFIVMDLVDGPNLADLGKSRVISVREAIRWAIETCSALEHAHRKESSIAISSRPTCYSTRMAASG